jgi:hypothetical protein
MMREASAENVDEMTQIKILQILLIFLNPHSLRLSKDFVDLVILLLTIKEVHRFYNAVSKCFTLNQIQSKVQFRLH